LKYTAGIFLKEDELTQHRLVDMILDKAGSKGTGKMDIAGRDGPARFPFPTIDMAVAMRDLSSNKEERIKQLLYL
jgi:6-phosphogluconate dehydrogenase